MPATAPSSVPDPVIVTTASALRAIVADEVDRAVRRTFASLVEDVAVVDDEWLTPKAAVKFYGRSRSTLHRWAKDGRLPSRKIAGSVYYSRAALSRMAGTVHA